jgi:hypothetical protein
MNPGEWYSTEGHALRVEKPIRMRVHRECHKCGRTFGLAKECLGCQHSRCKQCPRNPPKRTEAEREESRQKRAAMLKERELNPIIIADWDHSDKKILLRRPARPAGQDLIHKKPRQRIRRTCCQCQKLYSSGSKTCQSCQHARCTDCPRDPYVFSPIYSLFLSLSSYIYMLTASPDQRRAAIPTATPATSSEQTRSHTTNAMNARRCSPPTRQTEQPAYSVLTPSANHVTV